MDGKEQGRLSCKEIRYEYNDRFCVVNADGQYAVVDITGKELMSYGESTISYISNGYNNRRKQC